MVILVGRASETGLRWLQHAFGFPESPDERHADFVNTGFHRDAHFQMRVGRVHVLFEFGIALRIAGEVFRVRHPFCFAAHGEPLQQLAVQPDADPATVTDIAGSEEPVRRGLQQQLLGSWRRLAAN